MSEPNIVLFDLEVLNDMKEAEKHWFGLSDYPGRTIKAQLNTVICFGWKKFGKHEPVRVECAWDYPAWKKDVNADFEIVKKAREILEDADAVVGHNSKSFDWKFLQTRLLRHGLPPLPKIPHIDTKNAAKSNLSLFNNKLDNLGEFLLGDRKLKHEGRELWLKVKNRDPKAMKLMAEYCKQDVLLLEKAYRTLRPLMTNVPNHNLFLQPFSKCVCPQCGSTRLKKQGHKMTKTRIYGQFSCLDCASWGRYDGAGRNPRI